MPSLDWNRRWAAKLAGFVPGGREGAHYGDRWGDPGSDPALASIRARFLDPFVGPETVALEIGSGGGRWTQFLLPCRRLYCVELNPEMFDYLAARFADSRNLVFVATGGTDMPGVPESSVDFVFSYGTMVHLEAATLGAYMRSVRACLRPGGQACFQVANAAKPAGRAKEGFAATDLDGVVDLVVAAGLRVVAFDDATLPHSTIMRVERP